METLPPPHPTINLSTAVYHQLVYTLTSLLPPPLDDSPGALRARNCAAVAKVAAMLPVNANELDLAAQCIAARAQAEDVLRLVRENADDIELVIRLNAQYASMVRTSLSVQARLMRVQAIRQKREAIEGAANEDAWTLHIAEKSMLTVADRDAERLAPARPPADPTTSETVSETKLNSHTTASETPMSEKPGTRTPKHPENPNLHAMIRKAMAESGLENWDLPAKGCETARKAA
jgi:hypothetical protein